jgi:hypothetical protein
MADFVDNFNLEYKSNGLKKVSDSRKPKLTLYHLNKLKKIKTMRKLAQLKRNSLLGVMYGIPKEDTGGL